MRYQFTRAGNAARLAQARMIDREVRLFCKQRIEGERGDRVVGLDVFVNVVAVLNRLWRPKQRHHSVASSR